MSWIMQGLISSYKMWKRFQFDTWWTLTTGLISYYKLEDAIDYYWINNWSWVGSPTYTAWKVNNALTLNWTSQYLTISDWASLTPTDVSISFWIKTTQTTNAVLFMKRNNNAPSTFNCYAITINNWVSWDIQLDIYDTTDRYSRSNNISLNDWNWHHIVIIANHLNNIDIYKDWTQVTYTIHQTTGFSNTDTDWPFNIWAWSPTAYWWFNWQLDEVWLWNKVLSSQEITDLYNSWNWQTMV